jgi:hypothetical protein
METVTGITAKRYSEHFVNKVLNKIEGKGDWEPPILCNFFHCAREVLSNPEIE